MQRISTPGDFALRRKEGDVRMSECSLLTTVLQHSYLLTDGFDAQHRKRYFRCRAKDVRAFCWQVNANVHIEWTANVDTVGSHEHSAVQTVNASVRGTP